MIEQSVRYANLLSPLNLNSGTGTLTRHFNNQHKNWDDNDLLDNSRQQNLDVYSGTVANYVYKQNEVKVEWDN